MCFCFFSFFLLPLLYPDCFHHTDESQSGFWAWIGTLGGSGGWVYADAGLVSGTSWDSYPGRTGFNCDFHPHIDPASKLRALKEFHWIDIQTKAVVVEVSVYNKPTNLFSSMRLYFEFPRTGGIQPYYEPYTGFFYSGLKPSAFIQELVTLIVIDVMTLGFMSQEFSELKGDGCVKYFSSLWNALDWCNYLFLAGAWCFVVVLLHRISI